MARITSALLIIACLALASCTKNNPLNPSGTDNTASLHVAVDGITCRTLGTVAIAIDGTVQGNVEPGDNGLTRSVAIGQHSVSGSALRVAYGWTPSLYAVPAAGFSLTLYCP